MAVPRARKQSTVDSFLAAGIAAINRDGIDRTSVSAITTLANSTRPTFHSYFEDIDGLYADIWLAHGEVFLDRILQSPEMDAHDTLNRALVEILVRSRRSPEIVEVVGPQIERWWEAIHRNDGLSEVATAWFVGNRIGMLLTEPIDAHARSARIIEPVIQNPRIAALTAARSPSDAPIPALSGPQLGDESVETQILNSAIAVIANSGVAASSLTRIARHAQVTSGSVYPRFANIHQLVMESFQSAISAVTSENFGLIDATGFSPEEFGLFVRAGLAPDRKSWRDYRVEVHLAARVDRALADSIRETLRVTNKRVIDGLAQIPGDGTTHRAIAYLVHTIGIGLAVLKSTGLAVDQLDHRVLTRELVAVLAGSA